MKRENRKRYEKLALLGGFLFMLKLAIDATVLIIGGLWLAIDKVFS